jgi:hypothetical protein
MTGDPEQDAIRYAAAAPGSEEQRQAFAAFSGHWRGGDGRVNVGSMERWLADRQPARPQPQAAPAQAVPQGSRVSDDAYAKMSARDRLDYTRQFDQSKMAPWRDPRGD